ncbi:hypothetical protein LAZ67_19001707 [Cordylochernes scorpioides]|uniref:Uncharacterized protein n=1 Tax=Cordylochernes scorpioides TaxID=51811 RepID=A0ABY6LKH9_9ARAC|nr:hypothetical protein LAZ67_19001707 [Cordylochernes scorpioides]
MSIPKTKGPTVVVKNSLITDNAPSAGPKRPHQNTFCNSWEPQDRTCIPTLPKFLEIIKTAELNLRRSLRLKGLYPDLGLHNTKPIMIKNKSGETSSQVSSTYLSLQQPRCPSTFAGDGSQDAQKRLKEYKRVAKLNRWDDTMALGEAFGQQKEVIKEAESLLKNRAQKVKESSDAYIQDVKYLCQVVNTQMDDETKLGHLMKSVAEEIYQILIAKYVENIKQF